MKSKAFLHNLHLINVIEMKFTADTGGSDNNIYHM